MCFIYLGYRITTRPKYKIEQELRGRQYVTHLWQRGDIIFSRYDDIDDITKEKLMDRKEEAREFMNKLIEAEKLLSKRLL